jgi:hypothetical protein
MSTYEFVCICDANLRKEKSSVHSRSTTLQIESKKKKEEIICPQHREKKKNSENN